MPLALLFVGMVILIAAIRGREKDLFAVLRSDFTGSDNFFYWVIAIVFIVAIGYVDKLRPLSNAFLGLTVLVIILASYKGNKDLFSSFVAQVKAGTSGQSSSGSLGGLVDSFNKYIDDANKVAKTAATVAEVAG